MIDVFVNTACQVLVLTVKLAAPSPLENSMDQFGRLKTDLEVRLNRKRLEVMQHRSCWRMMVREGGMQCAEFLSICV